MIVSKFLDIKNDVAFKRIFGTDKNKDILIHFLNDMITFKDNAIIQDVTFLKTVQDPETAAQKTSIVDILCKDQKGHSYIIEIQVAQEKGFEKRAQYYAAKAYISQAHVGGQYYDLKEVIFLAIANFVMFEGKSAYKSDHVILDRDTHEHNLKDFSFTFIELPKFNKPIDQLRTLEQKWCYFLKHAAQTSEDDLKKLITDHQSQIIERAYSELERFSWNEDEIRIYDQAEKYQWAYQASMDQKFDEGLEQGIQQGKAEGIQEGLQKGLEKGKAEGIQEGLQKGLEKGKAEGKAEGINEVALNLLRLGLPVEKISEVTGLSNSILEELKRSISTVV